MSLRNVFENDYVSSFPIPYVRFLNTTSPVIRVGLDPLVQFGCVTVFDERSKPNDSFGAPKVDVSLVLAPSNDMPKTFFVIAPYQTVVSNHPSAVIAKIVIEYILAIPQVKDSHESVVGAVKVQRFRQEWQRQDQFSRGKNGKRFSLVSHGDVENVSLWPARVSNTCTIFVFA